MFCKLTKLTFFSPLFTFFQSVCVFFSYPIAFPQNFQENIKQRVSTDVIASLQILGGNHPIFYPHV